ncbi:DDE superfamily endonuclease domain [Trinorchestia longiramus]|nr:DDE superfamily endonuclease domain [Trinorchestia longiramus]
MAGFEPAVFLHEAETRYRTRAADHSTTVAANVLRRFNNTAPYSSLHTVDCTASVKRAQVVLHQLTDAEVKRLCCRPDFIKQEAAAENLVHDKEEAEKFVKEFSDLIQKEGYVPQQVFNADETGLFWKKMPKRTSITTKEEEALPGHKPMTDRLTLLLCGNASGDFKIKPLLVYYSDNPGGFKRNDIIENKLPVMWRANSRAWVTRQYFVEWVHEVFAPNVKKYLQKKNLPEKCLLLLDNAPAHPPNLNEDLLEFDFIRVQYLPPNTTSLLQPMNQRIISNFKKLYTKALFRKCFEVTNDTTLTLEDFLRNHFTILSCVNLIDSAWNQVTYQTMKSGWRKLWPDCVPGQDFEGSEEIVDDIVSIGQSMGLEIDSEDVEDHSTELTTEELVSLHKEQEKAVTESISSWEKDEKEDTPSSVIEEMCAKWGELQAFVEKTLPNNVVGNRTINLFNDNIMSHYRKILQKRQRQQTLDKSFPSTSKRQRREVTPQFSWRVILPQSSNSILSSPQNHPLMPSYHSQKGDAPNLRNPPEAMTIKKEVPDDELENITVKEEPNITMKEEPNITVKEVPNITVKEEPNITVKEVPNITVKEEPIDWHQEPQVYPSTVPYVLTCKKEVTEDCVEGHSRDAEDEVREGGSGACNTSTVHPRSSGASQSSADSLQSDVSGRSSGVEVKTPDGRGKPKLVCVLCDFTTDGKDTLREHLESKHKVEVSSGSELGDNACDQLVSMKRNVEAKHREENMLKCQTCDFQCSERNVMKQHKLIKHFSVKRFNCELCEYSCVKKSILNAHKASKHGVGKLVQCELCDFTAPYRYEVSVHLSVEHGIGERFNCEFCEYYSPRNSDLKVHRASKHGVGKLFKCELCDYSSTSNGHVERHRAGKHGVVKLFKCNLCEYSSHLNSNLKRHKTRTHGVGKLFGVRVL